MFLNLFFVIRTLSVQENYTGIFLSGRKSLREILGWIRDKVSIVTYFCHFTGSFQWEYYDSDLPPPKLFKNNSSCKPFTRFIHKTLLARLRSEAISLVGKVCYVTPPHLVLPLTVEPGKPCLCHDAKFLNLWMEDKPFTLDRLGDLPRYAFQDSYQTVLDDKSGHDHIFLSEYSRTFVGFQWGGWYFTYNTLPIGWKISLFVYHSTCLLATRLLDSTCLLVILDLCTPCETVVLCKLRYISLKV